MHKKLLLSVLVCLGFSACTPKKIIIEEREVERSQLVNSSRYAHNESEKTSLLAVDINPGERNTQSSLSLDIVQARLNDVALPFKPSYFISAQENQGLFFIEYKTPLRYQQIVHFYQEQMELLGWTEVFTLQVCEVCLAFKKGRRLCFVSVRPAPKKEWHESFEQKIVITVEN